MKNVDVRVTVDVRVDPAGVTLLFASVAAAWLIFKTNARRLSRT